MIDDEIRDALQVDPSPEFLARVRTRIANEPAPSAWRWSWTLAAGGAVAAAVIVVLFVPRQHEVKPVVPVTRIVQGPVPVVSGTTAAAATTSAAPAPATRSANDFAVRAEALPVVSGFSRTESPRQPEVLLDPAETRALRQLIAGARDGRVDLTAVQRSVTPAPMALEPVTDLVIAPIIIEPIAPVSGAEGVRP